MVDVTDDGDVIAVLYADEGQGIDRLSNFQLGPTKKRQESASVRQLWCGGNPAEGSSDVGGCNFYGMIGVMHPQRLTEVT